MKLVVTQKAKIHLQDLHDHYNFKAGKRVADKIRTGIIEKIKFLKDHPLVGQREELLEHLKLDHRRFVEGNYKILYRIEGETIYVTDIFDARQSPDKMLG